MKGRTYRYGADALFPFGHGLSYTHFKIGNAAVDKTEIRDNETIKLTIPVANTGKRSGTEIVQVYVRKINDIEGPDKTLRGFQRVELTAGKSGQAIIELTPSAFEFYDWAERKMLVAAGEYEVSYGNSSDNKDLKTVKVSIQ
jgi:beta-glucosidase